MKNKEYKRLVLCDYNFMLSRYYYARRGDPRAILKTDDGDVFMGSVEGFTMFTRGVLSTYPDTMIIFCQDGSSIERKQKDGKYKANREGKTEEERAKKKEERRLIHSPSNDIINILSNCKDVLFAKVDDKEGDDVIAQLSIMSKQNKPNIEVIIFSGDKDFLQLMSLGMKVSSETKKNKFVFTSENDVFTKFGVDLDKVLKFRVLMGDTSDNISPPVPMMKEKDKRILVDLWHEHGLDTAIEMFKETNPAWGKKVEDNKDQIIHNLDLMSLVKYENFDNRFAIRLRKDSELDSSLLDKYALMDFRYFLRTTEYGV